MVLLFYTTQEVYTKLGIVSQNYISEDDLDEAVADGYTDIYSLAEHFGVPEDFMRKAVCWYTHGNLATELYF